MLQPDGLLEIGWLIVFKVSFRRIYGYMYMYIGDRKKLGDRRQSPTLFDIIIQFIQRAGLFYLI